PVPAPIETSCVAAWRSADPMTASLPRTKGHAPSRGPRGRPRGKDRLRVTFTPRRPGPSRVLTEHVAGQLTAAELLPIGPTNWGVMNGAVPRLIRKDGGPRLSGEAPRRAGSYRSQGFPMSNQPPESAASTRRRPSSVWRLAVLLCLGLSLLVIVGVG